MAEERHTTGIKSIDTMLGGGFIPGTVSIVRAPFGVGKTILGMYFVHQGIKEEGHPGIILDGSNGDSQNHIKYAKEFLNWDIETLKNDIKGHKKLQQKSHQKKIVHYHGNLSNFYFSDVNPSHCSGYSPLVETHLKNGCKRIVIDGIDPYNTLDDHSSIRSVKGFIEKHSKGELWYEKHLTSLEGVSVLILETMNQQDLKEMSFGKQHAPALLSGANTVIYIGNIGYNQDLNYMEKGFFVQKHRGSNKSDRFEEYEINQNEGFHIVTTAEKNGRYEQLSRRIATANRFGHKGHR